jgi:hypothetical protein
MFPGRRLETPQVPATVNARSTLPQQVAQRRGKAPAIPDTRDYTPEEINRGVNPIATKEIAPHTPTHQQTQSENASAKNPWGLWQQAQ